MAQSKAVVTPQTDNLGNGQVDSVDTTNTNTPAVDTNKVLIAKMKGLGLDSKGLYTEWNNGALDSEGNNGALDMIDFMILKKKLTTDDKAAILTMFGAMAKANAPKVKQVKTIPEGLAEDLGQAWIVRHQTLAEYSAAKKAIDVFWCAALDASKIELDAVCKVVTDAGFTPDRKTGTIKTSKAGVTSGDGTHGNAGTTKLSIGWIDIKIGGKEYDSWKAAVQALEPSMISTASTNYLANTQFANKCAEKGLEIAVTIKLSLKDHTPEQALTAWNTLADDGKFASGAHRKLAEVGATITIA